MPPDLLYQIALTQIPHIGSAQARVLINHFGDAESIFKAKQKTLESIESIGEVRASAVKAFDDFALAEAEISFIEKYKITPLFIANPNYPQRLTRCFDAPAMLYYRGNADLNSVKIISIIGTRNNTDYGKAITEKFVEELAAQNVLILSGLAYGIDAIAHKAALHNQLPTIGVLAHGLDTIYPAQHKNLAKDILASGGGLLTEFGKETKADKHNFPRRNRIVAGMADATIVVETAIKGGSMITAELAHNYNRDVFAFPGKTTDSKSAGCNFLIAHKRAELLTSANDFIKAMRWEPRKIKPKAQQELFIDLSKEEKLIVQLLSAKETVHIDEIFLSSGLTSSAVAGAMLSLELQNIVSALPGKLYKLC